MAKKRLVMALGHDALGTNLPEQKAAVAKTAKLIADFIQNGWQVAVVHSNAPQLGMIHTAMNEFGMQHEGYTPAPMSVCSAMSQGYIGYCLLYTSLLYTFPPRVAPMSATINSPSIMLQQSEARNSVRFAISSTVPNLLSGRCV